MKKWNEEIKERARLLRQKGLSITKISLSIGVPRSSLHQWVSDLKRSKQITDKERLDNLRRIRPLATLALKQERQNRMARIKAEAIQEIDSYDLSDKNLLSAVLSAIYWAEGSKTRGSMQFANTDPKLALLYITLLRKNYKIDERRIRIRLHLHHYHNIEECKIFWSSLLKVPLSQFGKIYIKERSKTKKFRENFMGICFVVYNDENLKNTILEKAFALEKRITEMCL